MRQLFLYALFALMLPVKALADGNVAKIGTTEYGTLAAAFNEATTGQTVTLMSNTTLSAVNEITVNDEITLDLAGYTVTSTVEQPIHIVGDGYLTIIGDGKIAGPEGENGKALDGKAIITVEGSSANLRFVNGTLTCGGVGSDGMYGIYILDGGTAYFGDEDSKTGPNITSWFAAIGENNTTAPANITIYGGSYTAKATPTESDWWHYFCAPIYAAGSGDIDIYGGEFNGYYAISSRYGNVNQNLNIEGGTFNGTKQALFVDNKTGVASSETRKIEVSGGTFSSEVLAEYCAPGFVPTPNADGTYGVKVGPYAAVIGDQAYETLEAAINAASPGATIKLLKDVAIDNTIIIDKKIDINGDGHIITSNVTNKLGTFYLNTKNCDFTISLATIDGKNLASMAVCAYRGVAKDDLSGTVSTDTDNDGNIINLANCIVKNFTGWPGSYVGAIYGYSHCKVNIDDCIFTGNTTSQNTNGASGADVWVGAAAQLNICNGSLQEVFVNSDHSNKSKVYIHNGAVITELAICVLYKGDGSTNIPEIEILDNAIVTNLTTEEGNPIPADAIIISDGCKILNMPATEIAKIYNGINTQAFATLEDALAAATSTQTITLLADVEIESINDWKEGVNIDKNGNEITVTNFTVTDGEVQALPFDFKATNAAYTRNNLAGTEWGTICVPFPLQSCDAYTLYNISGIAEDKLTIDDIAGTVNAGTPVIFKNNSKVSSLTFSIADVDINATTTAGEAHNLVGTFAAQEIESGLTNIYYINSDAFHQAKVKLTVPTYRAYIQTSGTSAKQLFISIAGENATAIGSISLDNASEIESVYDTQGRKLSAPGKGINIIRLKNGKTIKTTF